MYNKNIIFSTLNFPLLKEIHQGKGFKCGMDVRWNHRNCRRLFKYNFNRLCRQHRRCTCRSCVQNHYTTKGDKEKVSSTSVKVHPCPQWVTLEKQNKVQQQEGNNSGSCFTNVDCWTLSLLFLKKIVLQLCMAMSGRLTHVSRDAIGFVVDQGFQGVRRHGEQVAGVPRICPAGKTNKQTKESLG